MMDYMIRWKKIKLNIEYNYVENQFNIEVIDLRLIANRNGAVIEVYLLTDEYLLTDKWDGPRLSKEDIHSMNQIIRLTNTK